MNAEKKALRFIALLPGDIQYGNLHSLLMRIIRAGALQGKLIFFVWNAHNSAAEGRQESFADPGQLNRYGGPGIVVPDDAEVSEPEEEIKIQK